MKNTLILGAAALSLSDYAITAILLAILILALLLTLSHEARNLLVWLIIGRQPKRSQVPGKTKKQR